MREAKELAARLAATAAGPVRVFRAPGRVNLIGGHTDYNDGFVMPAAIGLHTWIAIAPRSDRVLAVRSENFAEAREFPLDAIEAGPALHWSDHVRGVAGVLEASGHRLNGADLLIRGEVPIGAGLSSSAALQVAAGLALTELAGLSIDRVALARACQEAEHRYVGIRAGILDAFIAANGRADHALLLDCRSLAFQSAPIPAGAAIVIANTLVRHERISGESDVRRAECEAGVRHLAAGRSGFRALRDATPADLDGRGAELTAVIRARCRHVIFENARVQAAAVALAAGDPIEFGRLMNASHASLRDDYQVSCPELDVMVELAQAIDGVYGACMTGAGFGGSTVNLVREDRIDEFRKIVTAGYEQATGRRPEIRVCRAADGAAEVTP